MLFGLLLQATPAAGHLVMAHAAQYGRNGPNLHPVTPQLNQKFEDWWFKGNIDYPPKAGVMMNLPAGGVLTTSFTCSNGLPKPSYTGYTCGNNVTDNGSTHTKDKMNTPIDKIVDVRGTGIAIAYESDAKKIRPEDFAVFTVNYSCPWTLACDFHIPQNMPPCPEGGCTCMWGWIHSPNAGGQPEMYTMAYACNVTGATASAPIPPPKVARKCPINKNNCTVGAKQLHYWKQAERNNNFQHTNDPPFYNGDYGFMDGAQTDLWNEGDESLYADNCDWAPGPQLYNGPWSNLASGRPQWDGVPLEPLPRVYPTPVNCTSTKTSTFAVPSSTVPVSSFTASSSSAASSAVTSSAGTASVGASSTTASVTMTEVSVGVSVTVPSSGVPTSVETEPTSAATNSFPASSASAGSAEVTATEGGMLDMTSASATFTFGASSAASLTGTTATAPAEAPAEEVTGSSVAYHTTSVLGPETEVSESSTTGIASTDLVSGSAASTETTVAGDAVAPGTTAPNATAITTTAAATRTAAADLPGSPALTQAAGNHKCKRRSRKRHH